MYKLHPVYLFFCCLPLLINLSCTEKEIVEEVIIEKEIDPDAMPGLIHTVYFWLKEDLSEADEQDFLRGVQSLETIESVDRFFIGPPAATDARGVVDNSFSYALVVWFDDVAAHDIYQEHPTHLKFVEESEGRWDKVIVYDNELLK